MRARMNNSLSVASRGSGDLYVTRRYSATKLVVGPDRDERAIGHGCAAPHYGVEPPPSSGRWHRAVEASRERSRSRHGRSQ